MNHSNKKKLRTKKKKKRLKCCADEATKHHHTLLDNNVAVTDEQTTLKSDVSFITQSTDDIPPIVDSVTTLNSVVEQKIKDEGEFKKSACVSTIQVSIGLEAGNEMIKWCRTPEMVQKSVKPYRIGRNMRWM